MDFNIIFANIMENAGVYCLYSFGICVVLSLFFASTCLLVHANSRSSAFGTIFWVVLATVGAIISRISWITFIVFGVLYTVKFFIS